MPYKLVGKCVYRKDTGKKKGCSKTIAGAKKYLSKLQMVTQNESFNSVVRLYLENINIDEYYISLNNFILPKFQLGENKTTDTGIINPNEVGIYDVDHNIQIGKIQRTIKNNILYLEHIKIYSEFRGTGIIRKIYEHDEILARKNNLQVKGTIVNPVLQNLFKKIYASWDIKNKGNIYLAHI